MPAELPTQTPPEQTASADSGEQPTTAAGSGVGAAGESVSSPRGTLQGRWRVLSRLPIIMMLASLLLGLGIVQLTFQIGNSIYRSATWQNETRETKARVAGLQKDVKILQDAESSASDPAYLEQLARCQGFVGRNEAVIVSPNAPTNPGESCAPVRLP